MNYLGLKFLLWTNTNFWFQKTTVGYVFSIAINVFLWDWVKVLVHKDKIKIILETL